MQRGLYSKEEAMKRQVGLWIDHRETIIVIVANENEEIKRIASNMEKHVRFSGRADQITAEDMRDRKFTGHLTKYYDQVIAAIRDAESILIFGPGEAKVELGKRLEENKLGSRIVGIETVDKMTDNQIVAKTRQRFLNQSSAAVG
jgi:stalled ribosome rescue protein Dom34